MHLRTVPPIPLQTQAEDRIVGVPRRKLPWRLLAIAAIVVFGPSAVQQLGIAWRQSAQQRRLHRFEQSRESLGARHQRLTTDPVQVEGLIRSTFRVARPDELVVLIRPEELKGRPTFGVIGRRNQQQ